MFSKWQQKLYLSFLLISSSFFKVKSHEVTKQRHQGFSFYFCLMIEGSLAGSVTSYYRIRIREAQKHTDLTDQDLQNCYPELGIRNRIRMFLGLPDPDPLARVADPDPSLYS
jgi:hypothetical protein